MGRLLLFFVVAWVLAGVLARLPDPVGSFFRRTGILGVWVTAILLSWLVTWLGSRAHRASRRHGELRRLGAVESPHNHGKAGTLLLTGGSARRAVPHLERAVAGEPDAAEWRYRLGSAYLALGRDREAREHLERCVAIEPEHAYGAAQMRLAETLARLGAHERALTALATLERNHGPSPESAYRRGAALKALGRKAEARAAFREVAALASEAAAYQRRQAQAWALRARLAGWT